MVMGNTLDEKRHSQFHSSPVILEPFLKADQKYGKDGALSVRRDSRARKTPWKAREYASARKTGLITYWTSIPTDPVTHSRGRATLERIVFERHPYDRPGEGIR